MGYDLVVKGGLVTTASDTFEADIGVHKGRIAAVASDIKADGAEVVDARGLRVIPGGIDVHTHLEMPFMGATTADDFASGTTGAAAGGTTSIVDFAIQAKGASFREALDAWHAKAEGKSAVDYGFHMIITDLTDDRLKEMDKLVAEGVPSFKLFMAYPGIFMSDDATILRALLRTRDNGGTCSIHAENGWIIQVMVQKFLAEGKLEPKWHCPSRPMAAEAEATRRFMALAEVADVPVYVVHMSAGGAVDEVCRARKRGVTVYAETCPQYLYLSSEDCERPGFEGAKFVMSPPLRPKGNEERLWRGLAAGEIQVVATDHATFSMKGKDGKPGKELGRKDFTKIPNGGPGIESRVLLMWDAVARGVLGANRFVDLVSTAPARLMGMYPRKGCLAPGSDADIVLLDPNKKHTFSVKTQHINLDYHAYEGMTVAGSIRDVFVRGTQVVKAGKFTGKLSHGRFIKRAPRRTSAAAAGHKARGEPVAAAA